MENKKGSTIFLGVIGVATLVVAIIGATFAWFSASAESDVDAIGVNSTQITLDFDDETNKLLKTNLIPATEVIASYGGLNQTYIAKNGTDGKTLQCRDDKENEICSIYEFTIINDSTAAADLTASLNVVTNGFENLKYKIYEGTTRVVADSNQAEGVQTIAYVTNATGTAEDADASTDPVVATATFGGDNSKTPLTELSGVLPANTSRTYTMLIWIEEMGEDNDADQNAGLTAGLTFTSANGTGVTGVIGAMNTTQAG